MKILHQHRNYNWTSLFEKHISSRFESYAAERHWRYEYAPDNPPWYVKVTYKEKITSKATGEKAEYGPWVEPAPGPRRPPTTHPPSPMPPIHTHSNTHTPLGHTWHTHTHTHSHSLTHSHTHTHTLTHTHTHTHTHTQVMAITWSLLGHIHR